jgi:beta-glucosidase
VALVFAGLPDSAESEGFDREHIELPDDQLALIEAVLAANPRTVVVLSNGSVVRLSAFADRVPVLVEGWLPGQAGGGALADVLYGVVNPSGRLAETVPVRLEDSPAYLDFPGEFRHVRYGEGLFVGYRWYDARRMEVSYPFGHGLSYTTFAYSDLEVRATPDGGLTASVVVTNTGARDGAEVVQLYAGVPDSTVVRAPREVRAYAKVPVSAGESRTVELSVARDDLGYFDVRVDRWIVEGGRYLVDVGSSSRDIRLTAEVEVAGDEVRFPLSRASSIVEVLADPVAGPGMRSALGRFLGDDDDPDLLKVIGSFPVGRVASFPGVDLEPERLDAILAGRDAPSRDHGAQSPGSDAPGGARS